MFILCLSQELQSLLLVDRASDGPLCASLTTSDSSSVFKKGSVLGLCSWLFSWPAGTLRSWKHKIAHPFRYTAFWEFNLLMFFIRTFRGRWTQRKVRKRTNKGMWQRSVKWDLNPYDCGYMDCELNGLKAPWQSSVCFTVAAYGFCSV